MPFARFTLFALLVPLIPVAPQQSPPDWPKSEDGPKGFGAHSDQERILEASLHKFIRFHWDRMVNPAKAQEV